MHLHKSIIYILSLLLLGSFQAFSQSKAKTGKEISLDYYPAYNGSVSQQEYDRGKEILKNSYAQIVESKGEIVDVDYWNVAVAYSYMGENKDSIFDLLLNFKAIDQNRFCEYNNYFIDQQNGIENMKFYKLSSVAYQELLRGCEIVKIEPPSVEKEMKFKARLDLKGLNEELIDKLIVLYEKDQRYRYKSSIYNANIDKQHKLDEEVAKEIAEIIDEYGYPGKDLVGTHYQSWACLFVEHAGGKDIATNLKFKAKYFPIILAAYHKGQLDKGMIKMLVDRIHFFKNKKQVFGSHSGIPFYDAETLERLKKEYKL